MNIIAIDDNQTQLDMLVKIIKGVTPPETLVRGFTCGTELIAYAKENNVDIAFLDIRMPEISGVELAKRLKLLNHNVNIVFATGYDEYAMNAISLRASGYIMKPITADKVREEIENLRNPLPKSTKRVHFRCFGNFEIFVDNMPLIFHREKSKDVLAYLVDRASMVNNNEIIINLWSDEVTNSYFRDIRKDIKDTFTSVGCSDAIILQRGKLGINIDKVSCDYYDWQKGIPSALNAYRGEYMAQYPWAVFTKQKF